MVTPSEVQEVAHDYRRRTRATKMLSRAALTIHELTKERDQLAAALRSLVSGDRCTRETLDLLDKIDGERE
jgi:hypothetical protein